MGCTLAMALLGLCTFSFAGEPPSPFAQDGDRLRPAQTYQDRRAGGLPGHIADVPLVREREVRRRGVIYVRPRG
jgi:hypothetical protein